MALFQDGCHPDEEVLQRKPCRENWIPKRWSSWHQEAPLVPGETSLFLNTLNETHYRITAKYVDTCKLWNYCFFTNLLSDKLKEDPTISLINSLINIFTKLSQLSKFYLAHLSHGVWLGDVILVKHFTDPICHHLSIMITEEEEAVIETWPEVQ